MRKHWIWFAHRPGLGDRMKARLMQQFRDPEELYYADSAALSQIEGLSQEALQALLDKDLIPAEEILETCRAEKIGILTYRDAAYPARLRNIPDPPMVLYYKGQLPEFDANPMIAVVGTRKATGYGLTIAKRLGYQIGRCGGIVVSGLAFGVDAMAMAGALSAGASVVGVLGCGADIVYPLSNRSLFRDTEEKGCILSEFAPGTQPGKWTFPKRNRIISGLSNGVLVVEAPEKSGALITARLAAEQGRDVFVVPGNIDMPSCAGSNALLRDGARMVASGWDILEEYESLYPDKIHRDLTPSQQRAYPDEVRQWAEEPEKNEPKVAQKPKLPRKKPPVHKKLEKKTIDNGASAPYSDVNNAKPRLSPEEEQVVSALSQGERLADEVIAETGLSTGKFLAVMTMLELKGILKRLPGKRITLR